MRNVAAALLMVLLLVAPLAGREEEARQPDPLTVTARIIRMDPPALGLAPDEWHVPTEEEFQRLLGKIEAKPGPEGRAATSVAPGAEGTRLSVTLLNRVNYIRDYEVVDGLTARPILRTVSEGVIADLRAVYGPEGEAVVLEARVTAAVLKRPIQTFSTAINGPPITIELPELTVTRTRKTVRVPTTGGSILRAGGLTYLVVTAHPPGADKPDVGILEPR